MNNADLRLVSMVINEPGFKIIEDEIRQRGIGLDHVNRVTGNPFFDGELKGTVSSIENLLYFLNELRTEIKNMKGDD